MANNHNLTQQAKEIDSTEKAQRLGRLGGLKKGENAKRKRRIKELIEIIGNMPLKNKRIFKSLKENFSLNEEEICNDAGVILRIYEKALKKADVSSAIFIRNSRDETPIIRKAKTDTEGNDVPIIRDDIK